MSLKDGATFFHFMFSCSRRHTAASGSSNPHSQEAAFFVSLFAVFCRIVIDMAFIDEAEETNVSASAPELEQAQQAMVRSSFSLGLPTGGGAPATPHKQVEQGQSKRRRISKLCRHWQEVPYRSKPLKIRQINLVIFQMSFKKIVIVRHAWHQHSKVCRRGDGLSSKRDRGPGDVRDEISL